MINIKKIAMSLAVLTALGFNGCGSSSNDSNDEGSETNTNINTGVFLDSAVQGITYKTATRTALTDANGSFEYIEGEEITFSIGGIKLGTTTALDTLTPQEITGVTVVENSKAQDMLILLQTLDADHNASNGIEINEATRTASASMNVDFIEDTIDINSIITQFGIDNSYKVSDIDAIAHFQETLKVKYPSQGLKFTNEMIKNKSFYKIFVKEDRTTVVYVKVTFSESDATFTFGTKDNFINGGTGTNTESYSIDSDGILTNGSDAWELLEMSEYQMIVLNTTNTDDDGNPREERKAVDKWLSQKPVGFP